MERPIPEPYKTEALLFTKHICPVCDFGMEDPATDYNVCPSCGTEFNFSGRDYAELRRRWIENGMRWWWHPSENGGHEPQGVGDSGATQPTPALSELELRNWRRYGDLD